jgi:hypothetical protein
MGSALVSFIFFVNAIIEMFSTISNWHTLCTCSGDFPRSLQLGDWAMGSVPFLNGLGITPHFCIVRYVNWVSLVFFAVHLFFCWRLWKLRGSLILPLVISVVSLFYFTFIMRLSVRSDFTYAVCSRGIYWHMHMLRFNYSWYTYFIYVCSQGTVVPGLEKELEPFVIVSTCLLQHGSFHESAPRLG